MGKQEIFSSLLSIVSDVTEVPASEITSGCRREEVVDARLIIARCLAMKGFYPSQIASLMRQTTRNINRELSMLNHRLMSSMPLRMNLESVKKKAGII